MQLTAGTGSSGGCAGGKLYICLSSCSKQFSSCFMLQVKVQVKSSTNHVADRVELNVKMLNVITWIIVSKMTRHCVAPYK